MRPEAGHNRYDCSLQRIHMFLATSMSMDHFRISGIPDFPRPHARRETHMTLQFTFRALVSCDRTRDNASSTYARELLVQGQYVILPSWYSCTAVLGDKSHWDGFARDVIRENKKWPVVNV